MRNVADEGTVDLQRVDRELAKVRKRGKAGAEIVQRDVDPIVVELADGAFGIFRPAPQEDAFGDLQLQFAGGDSGLLQLLAHPVGQNRAAELGRRGVYRDMAERSATRRVGKECVSPCGYRWAPSH